jgi:hypothetical protein
MLTAYLLSRIRVRVQVPGSELVPWLIDQGGQ